MDFSDNNLLLENVDGWVLSQIKRELLHSGSWEKIANLCLNIEGRNVFSKRDLDYFNSSKCPVDALLDELVKRNITLKFLCEVLLKAELTDIVACIGKEDPAKLCSQSVEGLVYLSLGDDFEISVKACGIPSPSYLWYKGSDYIEGQKSSSFLLKNFSEKDEGIYLCLVRQNLKERNVFLWSAPIQLCIRTVAPSFIAHPSNLHVVQGEKIELVLESVGYPRPTFTWFKDGEMIRSQVEDPVLVVDAASLSDSGVYKCIAMNSVGDCCSSPISVEISAKGIKSCLDTPEIVHEPLLCEDKPERSIGQAFSLVCSARCCQNVTFSWVVNGRALKDLSSTRHIIMSSNSLPDFSSSLHYTVGDEDGSSVKVICIVQAPGSTPIYSKEVKIKVTPSEGPVQYIAGTKWALLIANTDYKIDPLPPLFTPLSDMERIGSALEQIGFHCLLLSNLNLVELKNAVKLFSALIRPGDYVVFGYAGHGLYSSGIDLLMPIPDHGLREAKEMDTVASVWVQNLIQARDPALLLVVLDMCRHVHVGKHEKSGYLDFTKVSPPAKRNCVILNATTEGRQSLEDPKTSSVLTGALLKRLKEPMDVVTMAQAVLRDVAHMSPYVRREQIPKLEVDLCDPRSLADPQAKINSEQEFLWTSVIELPKDKTIRFRLKEDFGDIVLIINFRRSGDLNLVLNSLIIECKIGVSSLVLLDATFSFSNANVKLLSKEGSSFLYEANAVHKFKDPLTAVVKFTFQNEHGVCQQKETIHLGLPGISKARIYANEDFNPSFKIYKNGYNI